jgi:hypothetical protein
MREEPVVTHDDAIWRAAIPGRPSRALSALPNDDSSRLYQPGRSSLEWSVLCSALSLILPVAIVFALLFARRARRRGSPRWLAALLAAVWCGLLGVYVRFAFGFPIVP